MGRKKDRKRKAVQEARDPREIQDPPTPHAPPPDPPNEGHDVPHFELGRPRSLFSIFIDALTAIVVVEGCKTVLETFQRPQAADYVYDLVVGSIWDPQALLRIAVFGTLFWFLLSDWADARSVDVWSPTAPSAKGMRFYLDVAIVVAFLPAFGMAADLDDRLAGWLSIIFLLCAAWAARIRFADGAPENLRRCCRAYIPMHLKGFAIFFVLEWGLFLARRAGFGVPGLTYPQEGLLWILLGYWGWELLVWMPGKSKLKRLEADGPDR